MSSSFIANYPVANCGRHMTTIETESWIMMILHDCRKHCSSFLFYQLLLWSLRQASLYVFQWQQITWLWEQIQSAAAAEPSLRICRQSNSNNHTAWCSWCLPWSLIFVLCGWSLFLLLYHWVRDHRPRSNSNKYSLSLFSLLWAIVFLRCKE